MEPMCYYPLPNCDKMFLLFHTLKLHFNIGTIELRNKEQRNNRNEEEIMFKKENIVVEVRKKSSFRSSVPTWNKRNFSIKSVKN